MDVRFFATVIAVTSLGALGVLWGKRALSRADTAQPAPVVAHASAPGGWETPDSGGRAAPGLASLRFDLRKWTKDSSTLFMTAEGVLTNYNSFPIKDFTITCRHAGMSDTFIDSNVRTIYQTVNAHGRFELDPFNMGFIHSQGVRTHCAVTGFSRA